MSRLLGIGLVVALLAACHSSPTRPLGDPILKFSRQPADGFCPPDGDVFKVTVWRNSSGIHTLTGTSIHGYDTPREGCISALGRCLVEESFATKVLSSAQVTELDLLLAAIPAGPRQINFACDPCLVTRYEFDNRTEDDNPCDTLKDTYRERLDSVGSFLRRLALGPAN